MFVGLVPICVTLFLHPESSCLIPSWASAFGHGILGFCFAILDTGFWIRDPWFLFCHFGYGIWDLGFWILDTGSLISVLPFWGVKHMHWRHHALHKNPMTKASASHSETVLFLSWWPGGSLLMVAWLSIDYRAMWSSRLMLLGWLAVRSVISLQAQDEQQHLNWMSLACSAVRLACSAGLVI